MPTRKDFQKTYQIFDWLRKMQNESLLEIVNDELMDFKVRIGNATYLVHGVYQQTEYGNVWGIPVDVYVLKVNCGDIYLSKAVLEDYELFKKLFLSTIRKGMLKPCGFFLDMFLID
jgi:hypothetical protein